MHPPDNPSHPVPTAGPALLTLGEQAPDFSARSTCGQLSLGDYRGRWVLLLSHPGDFTPVCTSEFVALAQAEHQFDALNCALLALSVDSLYSHLAWIRAIRDRFGVEVRFPIIEDPSMEIARAYGMLSADAADAGSVRSTFCLDPRGIVRAHSTYPATVGRSVQELLRLLTALQRVDDGSALAPQGWAPGQPLLAPSASRLGDVFAAGDASSWFYSEIPDPRAS